MMMMTNILKLKASYSNWVYYYTILTFIAYINKAYFSQTFLTCMQVYYFFLHSFLSQGHLVAYGMWQFQVCVNVMEEYSY
jgi:hypothetical protein